MKIYIKDKKDFIKNYANFAELVFWKVVGNKVHIKCAIPSYAKEVIEKLKSIKD